MYNKNCIANNFMPASHSPLRGPFGEAMLTMVTKELTAMMTLHKIAYFSHNTCTTHNVTQNFLGVDQVTPPSPRGRTRGSTGESEMPFRRHVLFHVPNNAGAHRKSRVFMQSVYVHVCRRCLIRTTCMPMAV